MKIKERKLLVFLVIVILSAGTLLIAILIRPEIVTAPVVTAFLMIQALFGCAYIGGNVWSKFIMSKYFHNELIDKE